MSEIDLTCPARICWNGKYYFMTNDISTRSDDALIVRYEHRPLSLEEMPHSIWCGVVKLSGHEIWIWSTHTPESGREPDVMLIYPL